MFKENKNHQGLHRYLSAYPNLCHLNTASIARGVAVGLFTACIPLIPFQTIMAITLSILIRANLAIALGVSWVSNPLTLLPITYFTYWIGAFILNEPIKPILIPDFAWNLHDIIKVSASFASLIPQFGKAFFVGLPIVAIGSAGIGYFSVMIFRRKK